MSAPTTPELRSVWEYIKGKLIACWESLQQEPLQQNEAFDLFRDTFLRDYDYIRVYKAFSSVQSNSRSFFFGRDRTHPGELGLWFDGLLQQIEAEMVGAEFTENTLHKIGHISVIGKFAKVLFSQLDAGKNRTAEDHILDHVANSRLFRDNRPRIVELGLESIAAERSAGDVSVPDKKSVKMQMLTGVFRLLMAPADNVDQTKLSAPEVIAEYIRAMEGYYNAERERRLANPEDHKERDAYNKWASDMYARELIWARQFFVDEKMLDLVTASIDTLKRSAIPTS